MENVTWADIDQYVKDGVCEDKCTTATEGAPFKTCDKTNPAICGSCNDGFIQKDPVDTECVAAPADPVASGVSDASGASDSAKADDDEDDSSSMLKLSILALFALI